MIKKHPLRGCFVLKPMWKRILCPVFAGQSN